MSSWAAKSCPDVDREELARLEAEAESLEAAAKARRQKERLEVDPSRKRAPASLRLDECCALGFYFCLRCYHCHPPSTEIALSMRCQGCDRVGHLRWCPPVPGFAEKQTEIKL